jgi:hypothetical protein
MRDIHSEPSIAGFCARQGISRRSYYNLRKAGKGPRKFLVGTRVIISRNAEAEWEAERQAVKGRNQARVAE